MKKNLKNIFYVIIPHEKNDNIPHILKGEFFILIIIFLGFLFYINQYNFNLIRNLNLSATVYPAVLADLANKDRLENNFLPLSWSSSLEKAAKLKAEDMVKNNYFAHTSPSGITPWYWLKQANYNFIYAGENLAVDFTESDNVQKAWLNSPKHKENIMNSNFTEIGIATAEGVFQGRNTTFVVEFFGKPMSEKVVEKIKLVENINQEENNSNGQISPKVAGVIKENVFEKDIEETKIKITEEKIDGIEKFIVAMNEDIIDKENDPQIHIDDLKTKNISTYYERFIFSPTEMIRKIYIGLLILVLISIILLLLKERRDHHLKHLILGIILIVIILILLYVMSVL